MHTLQTGVLPPMPGSPGWRRARPDPPGSHESTEGEKEANEVLEGSSLICWVCGSEDPDVLLERDLPKGCLFIAGVHAGCLVEANELSRKVATLKKNLEDDQK